MEKSAELEGLVAAWFESLSTGDVSAVDCRISSWNGVRIIGSDPAEWLQGGTEAQWSLRREIANTRGNVGFTPSQTEAFVEGPVGWAATKLTIALADGRRVGARWSAVLHREDEQWKLVQIHASIAVRNDEIEWEQPTG